MDFGLGILDFRIRDLLENNIFIDDDSFFDDGRGVLAVFYRHIVFDRDIAFKIDIAFDVEGFAIHQRRQPFLKTLFQKVNFPIKIRIQLDLDDVRSAGCCSFGVNP